VFSVNAEGIGKCPGLGEIAANPLDRRQGQMENTEALSSAPIAVARRTTLVVNSKLRKSQIRNNGRKLGSCTSTVLGFRRFT